MSNPNLSHSTASYRLQLTPAFDFAAATAVVPYLAELGISHIYLSPVFDAVRGSTHGYDVTNPARVRPELGGDAAFETLIATARAHGLGVIADIVPNHQAIGDNGYWMDVLAHGRSSPYVNFFDLSLEEPGEVMNIALPVLAEPYGVELLAGRIRLVVEDEQLRVAYGSARFPLAPDSAAALVTSSLDNRLEPAASRDQTDSAGAAATAVADTVVTQLEAIAAAVNADTDRLHTLLETQHYRLVWWRFARDEAPYRRFFDVNTMVAVRVEDEAVFARTHALILEWLARQTIDGVRVDHVDGLADPEVYLERLRAAAPDAWIGVEKILAIDEPLRAWPIDGTTGYEFAATVCRLLTAVEYEPALTTLYQQATGVDDSYQAIEADARHEIVEHWLAGDAQRLGHVLHALCLGDIRLRDYSLRDCVSLVRELAVACPVYRTYVRGAAAGADAAIVADMLAQVVARRPDLPGALLDLVRALFMEGPRDSLGREFIARFQQFTTAVAAKAVEDTACYRYARYLAANDVGASPDDLGCSVAEWHAVVEQWQRHYPRGMRTTMTHDSKRSEDVRARLTVLSEDVERWSVTVAGWLEHTDRFRIDGQPDRNFVYYLLQTLVGAWPLSRERAHQHAEKAAREAKLFTNWETPSPEYERAVRHLIDAIYDDGALVAGLAAYVDGLHPADWHKALVQMLLKLTVPGLPDIYQGSEQWQLSLVDPDNRAPVDFERLQRSLLESRALDPAAAMARGDDGVAKLWLLDRTLHAKRRLVDLSDPASPYVPLSVNGPHADRVLAFTRGGGVAVVVPTRTLAPVWDDTRVRLPSGTWRHVFADVAIDGGEVDVAALLAVCPVALLERQS